MSSEDFKSFIVTNPDLVDEGIDVSGLRTNTAASILGNIPDYGGIQYEAYNPSRLSDLMNLYSKGLWTHAPDTPQIPRTVDTLLNLLAQDDFETGPWEEFKLPLKTLGLSFGLFKNDDTTVDNIASAEAFRAKAYEIVLNSVSKMKGALSDKELGFLSAQGPTLSKTTEGNKLLLYLNKHQLNKASKFREYVISWSDENNEGSFPQDGASYNKMISDWKKSDTMTQNPYQYIENEAEKSKK